jgi:hypothetical protein
MFGVGPYHNMSLREHVWIMLVCAGVIAAQLALQGSHTEVSLARSYARVSVASVASLDSTYESWFTGYDIFGWEL